MNMLQQLTALEPLEQSDREQFIRDNQEAFLYGATQEFGLRNAHLEADGQVISRSSIEESLDAPNATAYRILLADVKVGGAVIQREGEGRGSLELFFVSPRAHNCGIGFAAWQAIERLHPDIWIWETVTPYFEKRNIHFYVNRCGFQIVEFFNSHHPDPYEVEGGSDSPDEGVFRLEKWMR